MELEKITPKVISRPPEITRLLDLPNTTVLDILVEPVTFRLFNQEDPKIIEFFVKNVSELLNYVFSTEKKEVSAKATALFEHCNPKLIEAALQNQIFNTIASKILRQKSISPLMISRISLITNAIIIVNPEFIETCGFIFQLFKYLSEVSVISLFESLCLPKPEYANIQKWLIQIGFLKLLEKEVDASKCPVDADMFNKEANLLSAYYYLIKICANNPVFHEQIFSHSFVYLLNRDIGNYPQFVEDCRWEALAAIYQPKTSEIMGGLFQVAIEIISEVDKCKTRASVAALNVLKKMADNDKLLITFINSYSVPLIVMQIMIENESHSILHRACIDFITTAVASNKLDSVLVKQILTLIVINADSENHTLRASLRFLANLLLIIMAKIPSLIKITKNVENFGAFVSDLQKYDMNVNTFYGGLVDCQSDELQSVGLKTLPVFRLY